MKKLLLSLSCFLISLCVYCQDIIVKKKTDEIQAKILEVGLTEVKYKNWNNQDGPTYIISKSDIFMIKYANGEKESFDAKTENYSNWETNYVYYTYYPKAKSLMLINGEIATIDQAEQILGKDTYNTIKLNKIGEGLGIAFFSFGVPVFCAGLFLMVDIEKQGYSIIHPYIVPGIICTAIGAALTAAGLPMAIVLNKKNKKIVASYSRSLTIYNQTQQNVKLSMANNGIGIMLNF